MKLNKLYSKRSDSNESLQEWAIEIEGAKYRTISGMVDGAKVTSEWTTVEQKNIGRSNETSLEEQAEAEAQAKWTKKYDAGYRETVEGLNNVDLFEPMLAKEYGKYKDKLVYPLYSQRKMDGIRVIARANGLWSRKSKKFPTMPHIEEVLKPIFQKYPNLTIDGEGYADKLKNNFDLICSLIKKMKPTQGDLEESKKAVQYHVYDCCLNNDMKFIDRFNFISSLLKGLPGIVLVETFEVKDEKYLNELYEMFLSEMQEGQIIRTNDIYQNKRTKSLLKRKEFVDEEFKILDITEGDGLREGRVGRMHFERNGKPFKANVMGTLAHLKEIWDNKKSYIGKDATVRYTSLTPDNIPRFGRVKAIRDYE